PACPRKLDEAASRQPPGVIEHSHRILGSPSPRWEPWRSEPRRQSEDLRRATAERLSLSSVHWPTDALSALVGADALDAEVGDPERCSGDDHGVEVPPWRVLEEPALLLPRREPGRADVADQFHCQA